MYLNEILYKVNCAEFDNAYSKALHIYMQTTKTKPNFVDV